MVRFVAAIKHVKIEMEMQLKGVFFVMWYHIEIENSVEYGQPSKAQEAQVYQLRLST